MRPNEGRARNHRGLGLLLFMAVVACTGMCAFDVAQAISAEFRLVDSLELNDPAWQLAISYDIPSHEQQPILVMYGFGVLRYVDGTSLEELSHRYLPEHGWEISQNGKFIAMCTSSRHEDSRTITDWCVIRWKRCHLWQGDRWGWPRAWSWENLHSQPKRYAESGNPS
jgi:hypothetical protein